MKMYLSATALALTLLAQPAPVLAGASSDFTRCDGLKKPKRKKDGMREGANITASTAYGTLPTFASIISACDRALSSDKLRPEQRLRRAHLLRARAAAWLEKGAIEAALSDLDAAEAELAEYRGKFHFDRSMGVSLDLIRAVALSEKGMAEKAISLAQSAAAKRPYAVQVQALAALVHLINSPTDDPLGPLWSSLERLDPDMRSFAKRHRMRRASFEETVALAGEELPDLPVIPDFVFLIKRTNIEAMKTAAIEYGNRLELAYAYAALGMNDKARASLSVVQEAFAVKKEEDGEKGGGVSNVFIKNPRQIYQKEFDLFMKLVRARIEVSEGRLQEAASLLDGQTPRSNRYTQEFYAAYNASALTSGDSLPALPELAPAVKPQAPSLNRLVRNTLMRPESADMSIRYKKSRPDVLRTLLSGAFTLGLSLTKPAQKTLGFSSTPNADGSVNVEYTGKTTLGPVVQEMTLLRAAELTREAGKSHFLITDRSDYTRFWVTRTYGRETARRLSGYKTKLTIRYFDDGVSQPMAYDAATIMDELGALYYSD